MFAAGFGLGLLTYYCATNCAELKVINGKERGSSLEDLEQIPLNVASKFTMSDVFLDYTTGDYYSFKSDTKEWRAEGNVSLHYTKKAALTSPIASFLKSTKTYRPKSLPELYQLYRSRKDETICTTRKQYLHHWLFEGIPPEYMALNDNSWDIHPVNLTHVRSVKRNYTILSDCDRGPAIVEHLNTIGMQCNVSKQYPQTNIILKNFVRHKLLEIYSQGRQDIPIDVAEREETEIGQQIPQDGSSANFSIGKGEAKQFTTNFAYCGLNYSKRRGVVVVANNAIAKGAYKPGQKHNGLGSGHSTNNNNTSTGHSRISFRLNSLEASSRIATSLRTSRSNSKPQLEIDAETQYKQNLIDFYNNTKLEHNMTTKFLHPRLKNEQFFAAVAETDPEREKRLAKMYLDKKCPKTPGTPSRRIHKSIICESQPALRTQSPYTTVFEQMLKEDKVFLLKKKLDGKRKMAR